MEETKAIPEIEQPMKRHSLKGKEVHTTFYHKVSILLKSILKQ